MLASRTATRTSVGIVVWNAMLEKRVLSARTEEFCRSISNVATVVVAPGTLKSFPQQVVQERSEAEGKGKLAEPGNEK